MITLHFIIVLAAILSIARAGSYQYIRFSTGSKKSSSSLRSSKSFGFSSGDSFTQSHSFDDIYETPQTFSFEESKGHISPDFSNGLDYHDPLLLRGSAARRAASYLYRKPLFFGDIDHINLLYRNQKERIANGLSAHKLASLRNYYPWTRLKHDPFFYNF